jgi:hypothetical protein
MARLVTDGVAQAAVKLSNVLSSRHEGGGYNVWTIQAIADDVPSGATFQLEASTNNNDFDPVPDVTLTSGQQIASFTMSSRCWVQLTGLETAFTGDVNIV